MDPAPREYKAPTKLGNDDFYEGEWANGNPHGHGTLFKADGGLLSCSFVNGQATGVGRLIDPWGAVYEGEFDDQKKHGKGKESYKGTTYEGDFEYDSKTGYGTYKTEDSYQYTGYFVNGKKQGEGKLEHLLIGSSYEGNFEDDMMSGKGTYDWPDGRSYTGEWLDDKMHGEGRFTWPDDRSYEGSYVHDRKEGYGVFIYPSGKKYEGPWVNGKMHGIGYMSDPNGLIVEMRRKGEWKDGRHKRWLE